ncbi:hypothetical protein GCM10023081_46970 [Arthrobacter ginkgonis]|uniref:Uncharacterized protein n=1 Tax=Arthrobacter ginkgonis TaxID=1630594 RepID=A0ABP7DKU1_9MICC
MSNPMPLEDTTWTEDALQTIESMASVPGNRFTADDLRQRMRPAPHPNHVGAAFRIARGRGLIESQGFGTSHVRSRHGGALRVWIGTPERSLAAAA